MTEKQLRESLTEYLSPADLPDSRKQALLSAIRAEAAPAPRKGDTPMFRPNKLRTALVAAIIVTLLSFTVAIAAGFSGYVNFKGEPVQAGKPVPTPLPAEEESIVGPDLSRRMYSLLSASPTDQFTHIYPVENPGGNHLYEGPCLEVDSLAELAALLPAEVRLPQPPEGYALRQANVRFECAADGAYELVRSETTADGIIIHGYRIPEDKQVASIANYTLRSEDKSSITVSILLDRGSTPFFNVDNAHSVLTPDIPGMDDAILITRETGTRLTMRRKLGDPIPVADYTTLSDAEGPSVAELAYVTIHIYSPTASADMLLSMVQ